MNDKQIEEMKRRAKEKARRQNAKSDYCQSVNISPFNELEFKNVSKGQSVKISNRSLDDTFDGLFTGLFVTFFLLFIIPIIAYAPTKPAESVILCFVMVFFLFVIAIGAVCSGGRCRRTETPNLTQQSNTTNYNNYGGRTEHHHHYYYR